jgi:hypothetical protein
MVLVEVQSAGIVKLPAPVAVMNMTLMATNAVLCCHLGVHNSASAVACTFIVWPRASPATCGLLIALNPDSPTLLKVPALPLSSALFMLYHVALALIGL